MTPRRKRGYWNDFENLAIEIREDIKELGGPERVMPKAKDLRPIVAKAVQKHGTLAEVAERMGLEFEGCRSGGYWTREGATKLVIDCQNKNKLSKIIAPTIQQLKDNGGWNGVSIYFGGMEKMVKELGLKPNPNSLMEGSEKRLENRLDELDKIMKGEYVRKSGLVEQEIGKRKRVGVMVECLLHPGPDVWVDFWNLYNGQGASCCGDASRADYQRKRNEEARRTYKERVNAKNPSIVPLEEYIDNDTPILHKCLTHDEKHSSRPSNVLTGYGLKCCGNDSIESISTLLNNPEYFQPNRPSEFYVYDLRNHSGYYKLGIDSTGHRPDEEYGKNHLSITGSKGDMWLLEQAMLHETRQFKKCPQVLMDRNWHGWTEVRKMELASLQSLARQLQNQLLENGTWLFALNFVPMKPDQVTECQKRVEA